MNLHYRVLAFGFDGILADNGIVPPALQTALRKLHTAGYALFMVTGRRFESVDLGPLKEVFAGIVWENGAVLHYTATDEVYLPFGHVDPCLVEALEAAGVPLEHGKAIVSTRTPHDETVWRVLSQRGGGAAVAYSKGTVMISPSGTAKGACLERLLEMCGFSPHNLVCFGSGENDRSLLQLAEIGVAVADAAPGLKEVADMVTARPGPAGVLEALESHWLNGTARTKLHSWEHQHLIQLGEDEAGATVSLSGTDLARGNLAVFGDSGSGKSWVTGLLAEGMQRAGYQILLIDPEGDFRGMRTLPRTVVFEGNRVTLPPPIIVVALLEKINVSVVLDLCSYPVEHREAYVAELVLELSRLKARMFRPHWIVLEEAQFFLPLHGNSVSTPLLPMLTGGGWAFVSYRPDRLASQVLASLDQCLLTRSSEPEALQTVRRWLNGIDESPANIPQGYAWSSSQGLVRLRSGGRRVPHIRHLYKYFDTPLPPHKRFAFRDEQSFLGVEAASLLEFLQCLSDLPIESLSYHQARGDFAAWAEGALGDGILATQLRKLAHRSLEGQALRAALRHCVASHYTDLHAAR